MKKTSLSFRQLLIINYSLLILAGCSVSKQISKSAQQLVIKDSSLLAAHVGISIYEPSSGKYWYNYQGDKYFVPASNTKLPTCYAAMKYLGDSLVGMRVYNNGNHVYCFPTGDPTFLLKEFINQAVFDYLKQPQVLSITVVDTVWKDNPLGSGWAWNDYNSDYMAERSSLPLFGDLVELSGKKDDLRIVPRLPFQFKYHGGEDEYLSSAVREKENNNFIFQFKGKTKRTFQIPFLTMDGETNRKLLADTLHKQVYPKDDFIPVTSEDPELKTIHSQPTDSLLKITMHRSDNFFAEQTLLMVSNERLGYMNDEKIIDTLLKTDLKDLPQKPRWVDGCGLSRYDLFTPQDFVTILNKIKNEFGMDRIKVILPTGNEGTLNNYYKAENGFIFAKTGTLSGVVALSGYLYTKKNKLLIFSVLVNNHQSSATAVRRAVEKLIESVRNKY